MRSLFRVLLIIISCGAFDVVYNNMQTKTIRCIILHAISSISHMCAQYLWRQKLIETNFKQQMRTDDDVK